MTTTSRRFAAISVVLALAALSCSDDKKAAKPFAPSSPSGTESASTSATGSGTPSAGSTAAGASSSTAASPSGPAPSTTPLRSAGADPALTGGPSTLPAKRTYTPPAQGAYTYANTGQTEVGGCAVDRRPAPPQTGLQVSAVRGARQEAVRGDAEQGTQSTVVEYRDAGIYLVSLVIDQPGLGRIEFRPAAPVLLIPDPAPKGREWTFTLRSTDGKYTLRAENEVTAVGQTVRLGDGSTVRTTSVRSEARLTGTSPIGAVDLTITTLSSAAADPALAVKEVTDTTGTVGTCTFKGHVESTLRSVRAA